MQRILVVSALAAGLWACSTQATLTLRDGSRVEAEIVGSDADGLYVTNDEEGARRIARADVDDIHHPGPIAAGVGTMVFAGGLPLMILGIVEEATCAEWCVYPILIKVVPGGTLAAIGLPTAIWGFVTYGGSVSAADGDTPPPDATRWSDRARLPPLGLSVDF